MYFKNYLAVLGILVFGHLPARSQSLMGVYSWRISASCLFAMTEYRDLVYTLQIAAQTRDLNVDTPKWKCVELKELYSFRACFKVQKKNGNIILSAFFDEENQKRASNFLTLNEQDPIQQFDVLNPSGKIRCRITAKR